MSITKNNEREGSSKQLILDSNNVENQNNGHNSRKAALGPNTKR